MRPIIVLSLLLACAATSAAEVYKWKDKNGAWHYGDRPTQGAEPVEIKPSSGTGQYSPAEMDRQARETECQAKRAQLETWRKAPTLSEIDNLGKQRMYSKAERDQFLAMAEQKAQEICSRPPPAEATGTFPPPPPAESPPPAPSADSPPPSRGNY
jgi:hypothetical protein